MKNYSKSVENAFEQRQSLIIVGLTGRTGSGCTTVSNILKTDSFDALHLKDPKTFDYHSRDERKYAVIHKFMKSPGHWRSFSVIEGSSIIFSFILERGLSAFTKYISKFKTVNETNDIRISAFSEVISSISGMKFMFEKAQQFPLDNLDEILNNKDKVNKYFNFYLYELPRLKVEFNKTISNYTCHREYIDRFSQTKYTKSHLYTFLMQEIGNNIRSSGDPYSSDYSEGNFYDVARRIESVIKIIKRYNANNSISKTRICIDAIRNPYEAYFFKDKYSSFYLVAIHTDESDRRKRLSDLDAEELHSLDDVEYEVTGENDYDIFCHQDIQSCLSISDIHFYNPQVQDGRYYFLTEQILKYIALMLHPGLVTPSHIERCMQTAYVASLNSGCLSRQVGAVITGPDFSVKAIGWNEVPEGQVPCNLRCIEDYCRNKDDQTYSTFEIEDKDFQDSLFAINKNLHQCDLQGFTFSYCFKDIYNGITNVKNQVHTRALHAEENAFLQLSKNGGQGIKGGKLFSTASPCELCSKKAYQLGIKEIYYIDPYPGISTRHILSFGKTHNPSVYLFYGAIGPAYIKLYMPRIPVKDELSLRSGFDCKKFIKNRSSKANSPLGIKDIKNISQKNRFTFNTRTDITEITITEIEALRDGIDKFSHKTYWTGSSFDGFKLKSCNRACTFEEHLEDGLPYEGIIKFKTPLTASEHAQWEIETYAKDARCIMSPYYAHLVAVKTGRLEIEVCAPENLLTNVFAVIYADTNMSKDLEVSREPISAVTNGNVETFSFNIDNPNLMYSYCIEWEFNEQI